MRTNALLTAALAALTLSGCAALADYGKVPHRELVTGNACARTADPAADADAMPFFLVTSRLPDCRGERVTLTSYRSPQVRYARFAAPRIERVGKKDERVLPLRFADEAAWWEAVGKAVDARQGRAFVYVHGYRESSVSSAKDTAQMARMTGFDGPVIHYTWPSQGDLLGYAVDETNMYWDERNFRRFLARLAARKEVKDITVVAHSLGARLLIPAIEFIDRTSSNADASVISNIILASPDVDRQDFERDIAEEVLSARRVNADRRITVYVSARDKALDVSRKLHGYPRLGSPHCFDPFEAAALKARGLPERCYAAKSVYQVDPVKSGFTIVDTSDVTRTATGHADYLNSAVVCRDFIATVAGKRSGAGDRNDGPVPHVFVLRDPAKSSDVDDAACRIEPL